MKKTVLVMALLVLSGCTENTNDYKARLLTDDILQNEEIAMIGKAYPHYVLDNNLEKGSYVTVATLAEKAYVEPLLKESGVADYIVRIDDNSLEISDPNGDYTYTLKF